MDIEFLPLPGTFELLSISWLAFGEGLPRDRCVGLALLPDGTEYETEVAGDVSKDVLIDAVLNKLNEKAASMV